MQCVLIIEVSNGMCPDYQGVLIRICPDCQGVLISKYSHHVSQDCLDVKVDHCVHPSSLAGLDWVGPVIKFQDKCVLCVAPVLQNLIRPYIQNLVPENKVVLNNMFFIIYVVVVYLFCLKVSSDHTLFVHSN